MTEPSYFLADPAELQLAYLDFGRKSVLAKVSALPEGRLRTSLVPSGWTPLGLVSHLTFAERHWFGHVVGGEPMPVRLLPDGRRDTGWLVPADLGRAEVLDRYREACERSRKVLAGADLAAVAVHSPQSRPGIRPTLAWVVAHLVHEYCRHLGHLDIVTELSAADTD